MKLGIFTDVDRPCTRLLVIFDEETNKLKYLDRQFLRRGPDWEGPVDPKLFTSTEAFDVHHEFDLSGVLWFTGVGENVTATYRDGKPWAWQPDGWDERCVVRDDCLALVKEIVNG